MRKLIPMIALIAASAVGSAQTVFPVCPEIFRLSGATTGESIKTLFFPDSMGMTLTQMLPGKQVPNEVGLEVIGNCYMAPATELTFTIGAFVYADTRVVMRVEMFNFVTNQWNTIVKTGSGANNHVFRPFVAPTTSVIVPSVLYANGITGEVRTRVFWTASSPFRALWIDQAAWTLSHD